MSTRCVPRSPYSLDAGRASKTDVMAGSDASKGKGVDSVVQNKKRPNDLSPPTRPTFTQDAEGVIGFECDDPDLLDQMFRQTLGASDAQAQAVLLSEAADVVQYDDSTTAMTLNMTAALLGGIGPRDSLEGMLAAQMVGVHVLAMKFLAKAGLPDATTVGRDLNVNRATKLLRVFSAQVEVLTKYRGKGEQKMEVKHVHVHEGGQAIVGTVNHGAAAGGEGRT